MTTIYTTSYTLVHVDEFGRVVAGTNLEFIQGAVQGSIDSSTVTLNLLDTGVTPGVYGGGSAIPQITINAGGQIVSAINRSFSSVNQLALYGDNTSAIFDVTSPLYFVGASGQISSAVTSLTSATQVVFSLSNNVITSGTFSAGAIVASSISVPTGGSFIGNLNGNVAGTVTGTLIGNQTGGTLVAANAIFTSELTVGSMETAGFAEITNSKTSATGVVVHDFTQGTVWYHTLPSSNFTPNITNLSTTNNRVISITILVSQGAIPYYPSAIQLNSVGQTIKWQDNVTPTATANKLEAYGFSFIRVSNTWTVTGSLVKFG
jgi:hypothetical protein